MRTNLATCLALLLAGGLTFSGCAQTEAFLKKLKKKPAPAKRRAPKKPVRKTDPKAQERAYNRGLRLFSQEKYQEAQAAWKQAVKQGPATPLGKKSKENLRKVEKILESLREIEQQ